MLFVIPGKSSHAISKFNTKKQEQQSALHGKMSLVVCLHSKNHDQTKLKVLISSIVFFLSFFFFVTCGHILSSTANEAITSQSM